MSGRYYRTDFHGTGGEWKGLLEYPIFPDIDLSYNSSLDTLHYYFVSNETDDDNGPRVYVCTYDTVSALDYDTGATIWSYTLTKAPFISNIRGISSAYTPSRLILNCNGISVPGYNRHGHIGIVLRDLGPVPGDETIINYFPSHTEMGFLGSIQPSVCDVFTDINAGGIKLLLYTLSNDYHIVTYSWVYPGPVTIIHDITVANSDSLSSPFYQPRGFAYDGASILTRGTSGIYALERYSLTALQSNIALGEDRKSVV